MTPRVMDMRRYPGECKVARWMDEIGLHLGSTKGEATRRQGDDRPAVIDFALVSELEDWEEGRAKVKRRNGVCRITALYGEH